MPSEQPQSERYGVALVVHLGTAYNSLNDQSLVEVEDYLLKAADTPDVKHLVVDLSATEFFGSRFIESLFRAYNRMKRKGGRFALCGLKPHPEEVIRVSRLDKVWPLFPDAQKAVEGLAAAEKN